jgi:hypothetical protein
MHDVFTHTSAADSDGSLPESLQFRGGQSISFRPPSPPLSSAEDESLTTPVDEPSTPASASDALLNAVDDHSDDDADVCFTDSAYGQRDSAFLPPMEFGRPTSIAVVALPSPSNFDTEIEEVEWMPSPEGYAYPRAQPLAHRHLPSMGLTQRPESPFMDTIVARSSQVLLRGSTTHARDGYTAHSPIVRNSFRGTTHKRDASLVRKETQEGWIGEWNQGDMQDVIQKLRSLR